MTSDRDTLISERPSTRGYLFETLRRLLIPTPMAKAGLFLLVEDAAAVISVLARTGVCQIERVPTEIKEYLAPCFPDEFRNAYRRLRELYEPLAQLWQVCGRKNLRAADQSVPSVELLNRLADTLDAVAIQANEVDRRRKQLDQRQAELEHFDEYVRTLAELDIDVEALADLRFLHLRVGTVPMENLDRIRESAALSEDLVLSLGLRRDRAHVLVVGVGGITPDLEGLLSKANFEPLDVSDSILPACGTIDGAVPGHRDDPANSRGLGVAGAGAGSRRGGDTCAARACGGCADCSTPVLRRANPLLPRRWTRVPPLAISSDDTDLKWPT